MSGRADREAFVQQTNVSRETLEKLDHFADRLERWTKSINLVARGSLDQTWQRHIHDSYQLYDHIPEDSVNLVDIGSGGGLPALVLAIVDQATGQRRKFTLIESDARKSAFLSLITRELGLNAAVLTERSESASPQAGDLVTSRAFAPLERMMPHLDLHLKPGGHALLLKGSKAIEEVEEAKRSWNFTLELIPSITNAEAHIVKLSQITRE